MAVLSGRAGHALLGFAAPGMTFGLLVRHAVRGWRPPVPVLRRLGVRTQQEIAAGQYPLRATRGDFAGLDGDASAFLHAAGF